MTRNGARQPENRCAVGFNCVSGCLFVIRINRQPENPAKPNLLRPNPLFSVMIATF